MDLNLAVRVERPVVVFGPCLEAHVAEIWRVSDDATQNVAQHGAVGLAILGLGGSARPGDVEDMRDVSQRRKLGLDFFGVGDVAPDVLYGVVDVLVWPGTACDAVHLPWTSGCVREW